MVRPILLFIVLAAQATFAHAQTDTIYSIGGGPSSFAFSAYYLGTKGFKSSQTSRDSAETYALRYQKPGDTTSGVMKSFHKKSNRLYLERPYKGKQYIKWHGTLRSFDSAGRVFSENVYLDDKSITPLKMYHPNGKLKRIEDWEGTKMTDGHCYDTAGKEVPFFDYIVMPEPPYSYQDYLRNNITYPKKARRQNLQGRVYISFMVQADGSIQDATVTKGIGALCDDEALRVIRGLPKWNPAKIDGVVMPMKILLPVFFKLQ